MPKYKRPCAESIKTSKDLEASVRKSGTLSFESISISEESHRARQESAESKEKPDSEFEDGLKHFTKKEKEGS